LNEIAETAGRKATKRGMNIFGLENRWKSSEIINDAIAYRSTYYFFYELNESLIQLPVGLSVTFSSVTALSSSAVAAAVL
jgi:hypothetical protein